MQLSRALKAYDLSCKAYSKISLCISKIDLNVRKSSYPYLCSDTYLFESQAKVLSLQDLRNLLMNKSNVKKYKSLYVNGDLVIKLIEYRNALPRIENLVIMESDIPQYVKKLTKLYSKVDRIFSNNLVGKSDRCQPIPLGLERQAYRSSGRLANFKSNADSRERKITFLIAWNDSTNINRSRYRREFLKCQNALIITNRLHAKTVHKLMRKSMFVPCPAGGGLDTHRVWEAIYLGAVPVVLKSEFCGDSTWPVIVVEKWLDIIKKSEEDLANLYLQNRLKKQESINFGIEILQTIFGKIDE